MKKCLVLLGLAWTLAGGTAWADGLNQLVTSTTTNPHQTAIVFNDSGSTLTSGTVVAWDNDDTEFDDSGYPYVSTTTTADSPWTAGVMLTGACPDQQLCEIVVYGPAPTLCADAADAVAEDTLVGTSATAGQCGDYGTGANTCALGMLTEDDGASANGEVDMVFVNVNCN